MAKLRGAGRGNGPSGTPESASAPDRERTMRIRILLSILLLAAACGPKPPAYVPGGGGLTSIERQRWEDAELAAASGQSEKAVSLLEAILRRSPDHVPSRLLLQDLVLQRDGPEIVRKDAEARLARNPGDWIARLLRLRLEADPRKRLAGYRELRRAQPSTPWTHLAVADAALLVADLEAARATEAKRSGTVEDRRVAVEAERARDRALAEARDAVDAALSRDPDLVPGLRRRGEVYRKLEMLESDPERRRVLLERSRKAYDEALALSPRDLPSLVARAALHRQRNDYASARRDLMKAIEFRPWDPDLHQNLGVVAYEMGEMAQAEKAFRNAVRLEPRSVENLRNLGDTMAARKKWEDATERYEEALRLAPDDPSLLERMGNVNLRRKRRSAALRFYRRYLEVGGPDRARVEAAIRKVESGETR